MFLTLVFILNFMILNESFASYESLTFLRNLKFFYVHHRNKQRFIFVNRIEIVSNFDSGNLVEAVQSRPYVFNLKIGDESV